MTLIEAVSLIKSDHLETGTPQIWADLGWAMVCLVGHY